MKNWTGCNIFSVALLLVFTGLFSLPAVAQEQVSWPSLATTPQMEKIGEDDVAVIVAIEDYVFLPNVPGAMENANDWENFFRRGFGLRNVYVLTNRDATREAMVRFARQAVDDAKPDSTVWFLFIGHGSPVQNGEDGGLVGMDALQNVESLEARSMTQTELLAILEEGPQARTVVAVDACFSSRTGDGEALAVGMQPVIPVDVQPELSSTTVVLSAARADQFAGPLPGQERPAFTYLLLGALRGWADEGSGEVSAEDAVVYVRRQLRGLPGRQQTPEVYGASHLVLARGVSEPDPERAWQEEEARRRQAERQPICEGGRVGVRGQCCWPGQDWSASRNDCVGAPSSCPEGRRVDGDSCVFAVAVEEELPVMEPVDLGRSDEDRIGWGPPLVGVGAAMIFGVVGIGIVSRAFLSNVDPATMSQVEAVEYVDRSNNLVVATGVLAGVGVAAAVVGVSLWTSRGGDQSVSTTIGGPSEVAISWQVRW